MALANRFVDLDSVSLNTNCSITEMLVPQLGPTNYRWDLRFYRNLHDRELDNYATLAALLDTGHLHEERADTRIWLSDNSGGFSSKSAFAVLQQGDGFLHLLQKKRRNSSLYPSWCVMCKRAEETVDHLFIHCSFSSRIWSKTLQTFGLYWVVPRSCYGLLSGQAGFTKGQVPKVIFLQFLSAALWAV